MALAAAAVPASAQLSDTAAPRRGSQQRAAILDAIRPSIETSLGPKIAFLPSCMQVWNGWALVTAEPQRKDGSRIDPRTLSDWENRDGLTVTALLRFRSGKWHLVDHAIGATDVWYDGVAPRSVMTSRCY